MSMVMKASYFAWLLVVKSKRKDTPTISSLTLSRMQPAPLPLLFDDWPVKTFHFVYGSEAASVNSAIKFVKTWALRVFLDSKEISNSKISIDYFGVQQPLDVINGWDDRGGRAPMWCPKIKVHLWISEWTALCWVGSMNWVSLSSPLTSPKQVLTKNGNIY